MSQPLVKRIDTVFLPVSNLEAAVAWFNTHLGLELRWKHGEYAALNVGETPLTLFQTEAVETTRHESFNFYAPDIAGLRNRLAEAGVEVSALTQYPDVSFFTFRGPDGHLLAACWFEEK